MIESIMFFGGGFLVAGLLALVLISFVHHRAVRLTQRRLEDAIPVSLAEIQADKDSLRAEFAVATRRLEMTVEQLKAKATTQLGDIARKTEAIARLKAELAEKTAVTDELYAKARSLGIKLQETEQESTMRSTAVESTAQALAATEAELARATDDIHELTLTTETQHVEIALLRSQIEQFKAKIDELQQDAEDAARRLFDERVAVSTLTKALEEKRPAAGTRHPQVAQLGRETAAATEELELRSRRIAELEARIHEQDRLLKERETEETWRAERTENNLLRERITDIAAQVAHMSLATDKAASPIAAILKEPTGPRQEGGDSAASGGKLIERIRKLQQAAPRVSTAS